MAGKPTVPPEVHEEIRRLASSGLGRREIAQKTGRSLFTIRKALDAGFAERENARHRASAKKPASGPARDLAHAPALPHKARRPLVPPVEPSGDATEERPPRYPKHRWRPGIPMSVDGIDLGRAMYPQDIFIAIKHAFELSDHDVLQALSYGADRLEQLGPHAPIGAAMGLPRQDRKRAIDLALESTRSRVTAWRRRHREMTWLELRVLLLGLKTLELGPDKDERSP